jgi:hypothetical protein
VSEWQPISTIPEERPVLILWDSGDSTVWKIEEHPNIGGAPSIGTVMAANWAPLPTMPAPDPMTVVAWHPMETLPNQHNEPVLIRYVDHHPEVDTRTIRGRSDQYRTGWCPLAPLLDLIDKAEQ